MNLPPQYLCLDERTGGQYCFLEGHPGGGDDEGHPVNVGPLMVVAK